jgi:D-glycero-alpha-D-manno-heptose-7-phosphate kinase
MIFSKTPFRVSLFGGGTDYEDYYSKYDSLLIGFTINKYAYLGVRETPSMFDYYTKVTYSQTEFVEDNSKIKHNGVRGVLDYYNIKDAMEISHFSDLPAQTGIGSSSSFIVGLVNSINALKSQNINKENLALTAIDIERNKLNEAGGIQDQIWAAYGGFNAIQIYNEGRFEVIPLLTQERRKKLLSRMFMIYTGKTRQSYEISKTYKKESNENYLHEIQGIAEEAYHWINKIKDMDKVIDRLALLLKCSWEEKMKLSPLICTDHVSSLMNELYSDGMIGGKLIGAGGSGFIVGITNTNLQKQLIEQKFKKQYIPIDFSFAGSEIIHVS